MEDWAETRAREYNTRWWKNDWEKPNAALAALLREVWEEGLMTGSTREAETEHRALLAEVRRVVQEESASSSYRLVDRILSRLESL